MNICTDNFKNALTSSSHANFRLDIFHSKALLYSFWGYENGLKAGKNMQTLFTFEYLFTLSYFYMFTHIAYEHIHLGPAAQADNC